MIKYTIEIEGEFITFVGVDGTSAAGTKEAHRKQSISELYTKTTDAFLTLVKLGDYSRGYNYTEVEDPSTVGIAFVDLETFRVYILNNLTLHF